MISDVTHTLQVKTAEFWTIHRDGDQRKVAKLFTVNLENRTDKSTWSELIKLQSWDKIYWDKFPLAMLFGFTWTQHLHFWSVSRHVHYMIDWLNGWKGMFVGRRATAPFLKMTPDHISQFNHRLITRTDNSTWLYNVYYNNNITCPYQRQAF